MRRNASLQALKAAKELVDYIEFFRSHGTGETMAKYPDDDAFGGYDNIVRRAHELAAACEGFDGGARRRAGDPMDDVNYVGHPCHY